MNNKTLVFLVIIIFLVATVPRKIYIAPQYSVSVSDTSGAPLPNVKLHEYVQDYSFGVGSETSNDTITDMRGNAFFPGRTRWLSVGSQLLGCTLQLLQSAHASCGFYSDVTVSGNFVEKARVDQAARFHPSKHSLKLTMASCPSGDYWKCAYPNGLPSSSKFDGH